MNRAIKFRTFFNEPRVPPQMIYFHLDDFIRNDKGLVVGQASLQSNYQQGYKVEYWPVEQPSNALPDQLIELSDTIWKADNSPLMQFTGLLDKNGIEIYEGDLVKWEVVPLWMRLDFEFEEWEKNDKPMQDVIYKVEWNRYCYACFSPSPFVPYKPEVCEVIGNVFENHELVFDTR